LNIDEETQEKSIKVDDVIAAILKPHQIEGVKFMWDCCFESVKMIADPKNEGSGCLLAHCMGLGKTLQVIALSHTVFAHRTLTKCNRILILMPVNVQLNWKAEFVQWTEKCKNKVQVYDLPSNKLSAKEMLKKRLDTLEKWFQKGGIFLMGYEIFSRLVHGKDIKQKKQQERFTEYLINPGPDLIVCDEGHLLKNATSQMAIAVNQIKTKRRIVLTGTPLQNNLSNF
jgi:transcriptional regulator ATRX